MNDANGSKTDGPSKSKKRRHGQQENNEELERRIHSTDWIVSSFQRSRKRKTCTACSSENNNHFISSPEIHFKNDQHKQHALLAMSRDAELKLAAFFAEHNIPFHVADKLGPVLKDCFLDSKICQELTVNRETMESTIINSIGPNINSELANKLRTCKFSILADELTDISSAKTFCIMVRYFDDNTGRIKTSFWKLSSMENRNVVDREAMAEHLYEDMKKSFIEFNIPNKNIVGFGSDGCNVIMSGKNSVPTRFEKDCPGIFVEKFTNHSIYLCASKAAENQLPARCEELARAVHSSLKCKVDKSPYLVELQELFDLEPHKRLHPSQARWISLPALVDCMLDRWDALIYFYEDMSEREKLSFGKEVLSFLRDPFIKLYYYFLRWVLGKFNELNAAFESSDEVITELNAKIEDIYKDILECFLKRNYVKQTRLQDIDLWEKDEQLPDSEMDLGDASVEIKKSMNDSKNYENKKVFYQRCRKFLQQVAMEIGERWVFGNSVMEHIRVLNPKVARSERVKLGSILRLAETLPRIKSDDQVWQQSLIQQWGGFLSKNKDFPQDILKENEPDVFWGKILNWKNGAGEKEFSVLAGFALDALVIPHTNADYARIFEEINLRRTGTSNKLVSDREAICRVAFSSSDIKRDGTGRMVFQRSTEMINNVESSTVQVAPELIASTSQT